ncbi:hypothetical protein GCM10009554_08200 [Kribbella koreensis]|uniref:Uncharacterized protein n=1 Tax=Kribbella koreensis TaxID=57909 RepID=A0ABP3ZWB7_9ACTN
MIGIRLGRPEIAVAQKAAQAGITLEPANQPPYGKSTAEPNPIQPLGSPEQPDGPAGYVARALLNVTPCIASSGGFDQAGCHRQVGDQDVDPAA